MPDVVLAYPTQGKDDKETIRNLTDVVYKIQKELDYLLQNLDSKNIKTLTADKIIAGTINLTDGITISSADNKTIIDSNGITMFEGSISWENVNVPTTSQVGAKPYDWLPEYGDISGIKPPANADNTFGIIGANRLTYIDEHGIYTGTLTANQIKSQVGARPDNWTPNASEVGARPYDWIPAYGDISGIKPPTNADNTTSIIGADRLTYIDANGIYTGTLTANQINVISGLTLGANATINWAQMNKPTASQVGARADNWTPTAGEVGARPDNWVPTASQVGARPYDWLPAYGDITGIKPPSNADNTFGTIGSNRLTYIDGNGIYTGTLTANQINVISGLTLGSNATINWAQMNKPTASQVGARADNWTPNWTDVGGRPNTTYIDANGIYTGTLIAENINGTYLTGKTVRTSASGERIELSGTGLYSYSTGMVKNGFIIESGNFTQLGMFYNDAKIGYIGRNAGDIWFSGTQAQVIIESKTSNLKLRGGSHYNTYGSVIFEGNVDFSDSSCTISGTKKIIVQSTAPTGRSDAIWVKTA